MATYSSMIEALRKAQQASEAPVASEYGETADIYRTGGEYGAGAIARIEDERQKGVAGAQANLASTGMSSGSLAVGVGQRYARAAGRAVQEVEDVRYEKLGNALLALGAAKEARGQRISQTYASTAQLIQGWKGIETSLEQTKLGITSAEKIAEMGETGATRRARIGSATQISIADAKITAEQNLAKQAQTFKAQESAKYNLTAPQKYSLSEREQTSLEATRKKASDLEAKIKYLTI